MPSKFVFMASFERSLKKLIKRYPHIKADVADALTSIESNARIGTVIPDDFAVRKLRVASRDMRRGKRGGFRLLYKLSAEDEEDKENTENLLIYLLFMYAKTDQEDVGQSFLESLVNMLDDSETLTGE